MKCTAILFALWVSGCGGDDDDDTGTDGDADADADADDTTPVVTADPELVDTVRPMGLLETTLVAEDPDDETFTWTVVEPPDAILDPETGSLAVRVPIDAVGSITVSVDVSDGTNTARFEHTATVEPLGWEEVAPAWDAQYFTATAFDEGRSVIWSIGGFGETRSAVVMRGDLGAGTWERAALAGDALPPLFGAGACHLPSEDLVVVAGGFLGHLPREFPRNRTVYLLDVGADPVQVTALSGDEPPEAIFPRLACSPDSARAFLIGTFDLEGIQMTPLLLDVADGLAVTELQPEVMPEPRAYFGLAVVGSVAYLFGGDENPGEPAENFSDVWSFDLDEGGSYTQIVTTGTPPAPRANVAMGSDGATIVVAGGFLPGEGPADDVHFLDLSTAEWSEGSLEGEAQPFLTQTSVWENATSTLHLLAPTVATELSGLYTDARDVTLAVDVAGSSAEMVFADPAAGQGPRRRFSALVGAGGNLSELVVHGGSTALLSAANALDDTWTLDVDTGAWSAVQPEGEGPGGRQAGVFVADDRGRILSIGGWDGDEPSDMEIRAFDPDGGDWRTLESRGDPLPEPRVAPCAAFDPDAGTVLLFGGVTRSERSAEVWEIAIGSSIGQWRLIDTAAGPEGRAFAGCGFDGPGQRFIVFGGEDRVGTFADLWALDLSDPGRESWTQLEPDGEGPAGLTDVAAVVDPIGRKLVVFGGTTGLQSLGDVWFLDLIPGQEAWTLLPWDPTGPELRAAAGATYHVPSQSLLIFGGRILDPGIAALNDVWRFPL